MTSIALRLLLITFVGCVSSWHLLPPSKTQYHRGHVIAISTTTPIALLPRDEVAPPLTNSRTCGYTSGQWFSAVTCSQEASCTYYTEPYSAPNFGCCTSGEGCGYVSTCVDYTARNNPQTGAGVLLANEGFYCGSDAPYCSTLVLYGQEYTSGGTYSFLSYSCQTGSGTRVTAFQTTHEPSSSSSQTTSSTSSQNSTSSAETDIPTQTSVAASSSATLAETAATETAATTTSDSDGLSQGAQIGIGVGLGLVGAGIIIAATLWFRHRRVQRNNEKNDTAFAHYADTRDGYGRFSEGGHQLSEVDSTRNQLSEVASTRKQDHPPDSPVELLSASSRHELDGSDMR